MIVVFFVLWLIFNGRLTVEIILLGLLFAAALSHVFYRLLGHSFSDDLRFLKNLPLALLYVGNLILEILKAAFLVIGIVWAPGKGPEPVMVEFHSGLEGDFANVILANSITLTPGTFTVSQKGDHFVIHCLREEFSKGLDDSSFIHLLRRIRA